MNVPHSIFERLKAKAKRDGADFNYMLQRYAIERLLYRVSVSKFKDRFILKGAMLFLGWTGNTYRVTRDADFLAFGDSDLGFLRTVFEQIAGLSCEDGLAFEPDSVVVAPIRDDQEYQGVRAVIRGKLYTAKVSVQVDIGFGDAITPQATELTIPTILDLPAPILMAYPRYTVVAEKFEAMVQLGMGNSRMKDFYDIFVLLSTFEFDGATLQTAVQRTFQRRGTPLPTGAPLALTRRFSQDKQKIIQWNAFKRKARIQEPIGELSEVVDWIAQFIEPLLSTKNESPSTWEPGIGWKSW